MLELCQERQLILTYSEDDILREAQNISVARLRSFIHRDGLVAGLSQALFLQMSAQLTNQLGVAPGGEFRAGYEEAQRINAKVVLGDRPVGITFKRVLACLSFWQRLYLLLMFLRTMGSGLTITPEEVEALKSKDMVTLVIGELASELPAVSEVFVTERDQILTYSLMQAANCAQHPFGHAVTVVGVVGMGHTPGIELNWMQPTHRHLGELFTVPAPSPTSTVAWKALKISAGLGLLSFTTLGVYILVRRYC